MGIRGVPSDEINQLVAGISGTRSMASTQTRWITPAFRFRKKRESSAAAVSTIDDCQRNESRNWKDWKPRLSSIRNIS